MFTLKHNFLKHKNFNSHPSALPQEMIVEFEHGIICQESVNSDYSYGVMKHMISVKKGNTDPLLAKKQKLPPLASLPEST